MKYFVSCSVWFYFTGLFVRLFVCLLVCLFWSLTLHSSFSVMYGRVFLLVGYTINKRKDKVSCSRPQRRDSEEALARSLSIPSQAPYHWVTMLLSSCCEIESCFLTFIVERQLSFFASSWPGCRRVCTVWLWHFLIILFSFCNKLSPLALLKNANWNVKYQHN